jgi:biotin carboxyl carrier protein
MYQVHIQGDKLEIQSANQHDVLALVNGKTLIGDVIKTGTNSWHMIADGKSYRIQLLEQDLATKSARISINGKVVNVSAKNELDLMLEKMGLADVLSAKVNDLKAPMPGLVLDIKVAPGDIVKKGDALLVLEAMKMENILKSPIEGVIKKIAVEKGTAVEKNALLLIFES